VAAAGGRLYTDASQRSQGSARAAGQTHRLALWEVEWPGRPRGSTLPARGRRYACGGDSRVSYRGEAHYGTPPSREGA